MAGEYLVKARKLPDGFPFALAGIGVVILILLGLGGALFLRRRTGGRVHPDGTSNVPVAEPPAEPVVSPEAVSVPVPSSGESARPVGFGTHPMDSATLEHQDVLQATSRVCPSCGAVSSAEMRYCGQCGSAL